MCHNQLSLITVHTKLETVYFTLHNIALSMEKTLYNIKVL